jgi:hypothetical protein
MECWNQADMDVSGRILRAWMPAVHAGMTENCFFMFCGRARMLMEHFVVKFGFPFLRFATSPS